MIRFNLLLLYVWLSTAALLQAAPVAAVVVVPAPSIQKLLAQAHTLQEQYHESEALATYEEILAQDARHYEALWQAALLSVRIGARYTDETRKTAYFVTARQYADRALAVQPEGGEANYAVALTLVTRATLLHAQDRLRAYKTMKPYVFMAVARQPNYADAWQLLGRWHYRVDHYNIFERIFSRFFLGGMPSGASSRKAIDALMRAHQLDSTRIQFCYDLGRVYHNQGQHRKAIAVLKEGSALQPTTSDELELSRRCRYLLQQVQRRHGLW